MNAGFVLLLAAGIGAVAGLRALTAVAVVAWAAHFGWLNLANSSLAFMGSVWAAAIFTLLVAIELITDQLPTTPARTTAAPFIARIISGMLAGACLGAAGGVLLALSGLLRAIGAIAGTFGGYKTRVGLVRALRVPDFAIAIPEDIVALCLGLLIVTRF